MLLHPLNFWGAVNAIVNSIVNAHPQFSLSHSAVSGGTVSNSAASDGAVSHSAVVAALPIRPSDVVGCRHRTLLKRAVAAGTLNPDRPGTFDLHLEKLSNIIAIRRRRAQILAHLPTAPRAGDRIRHLNRVDITAQDYADNIAGEKTLEALADGARLITNAHLAAGALETHIDLLVREDFGVGFDEFARYIPVTFSGHSVAKKVRSDAQANCRVLDLGALGLSAPMQGKWRRKSNPGDSQRLAIAHSILSAWGIAAADVGCVATNGEGAYRCFFSDAAPALAGLSAALRQPVPTAPVRIKECATCEFHDHCRAQLVEKLDISLLLPGAKSQALRAEGIDTLPALVAAEKGEQSLQAGAWLRGEPALRRRLAQWVADPVLWGGREFSLDMVENPELLAENLVEIDIDMEAHPEHGTFLWGTFDGSRYIAFEHYAARSEVSKAGQNPEDARHVAEFWAWLMAQRDAAVQVGKAFQVWVYSAQGENYWLRYYADHFGGQGYEQAGGEKIFMPTRAEVEEFLGSAQWCDVFEVLKKALVGTGSLGLKNVAPLAGFRFTQKGVDGRAAVSLFEQAISPSVSVAHRARKTLERYNADDCYATRAVRGWLRRGAPGLRGVEEL